MRACSGDDHPYLPCRPPNADVRVVALRARVLSVGRFRVPPTRPGPTVVCAVPGRVAAPSPLNIRISYEQTGDSCVARAGWSENPNS